MNNFRKIYNFTNENVNSFNSLYNFIDAKVLSVLGSGDQYFTSILNGAFEIELFDINSFAWDYFIFKYKCISILSYEDFFDYFVIKKLDDRRYFDNVKKYLPYDVLIKFENLYNINNKISWIFEYDDILINYDDGSVIPYLKKENYYKLQNLLSNRELPTFYFNNFINLPRKLNNKIYDIILVSNIFNHIYSENMIEYVFEFKEILNKFNFYEMQAFYCWWLGSDFEGILVKNDFIINSVESSKKLKLTNDYVISLRK